MQNLHVSIIGAGLGGLCLAQGLARAGIDVDVYERDARTDSRVQGYRLRIDATGQAALAYCLSPELNALFQQSCSAHDHPGAMLDARLQPLPQRAAGTWQLDDGAVPDRSAHRQTLREILLSGLETRVHFDRKVIGLDAAGLHLDGLPGRTDTLVVAADGVHSVLRRQHLPQAQPEDTGTVTIFGVAPAGCLARNDLPADLQTGAGVVFGPGYALVLDAMQLPALPQLARQCAAAGPLSDIPSYQYWAVIGERAAVLGTDAVLRNIDAAPHDAETGQRWQRAAERLLAPVHPALAAMVAASDPAGIALKTVYSAPALPRWTQPGLTFLGDAVHAMSPAGGLGANTALADAQSLATLLAQTRQGLPLGQALHRYDADLRQRGDAAVRQSALAAARIMGR